MLWPLFIVKCGLMLVYVPSVVPTNPFVVFAVVCFPGGLFSKTEMSEVLTEIVKADPSFDKDNFLKQCEKDIIPNILEVNRLSCSLSVSLSLTLNGSSFTLLSLLST